MFIKFSYKFPFWIYAREIKVLWNVSVSFVLCYWWLQFLNNIDLHMIYSLFVHFRLFDIKINPRSGLDQKSNSVCVLKNKYRVINKIWFYNITEQVIRYFVKRWRSPGIVIATLFFLIVSWISFPIKSSNIRKCNTKL